MDLLALKLIVTPLLLVGASLASRKWGDAIGGLMVGLPLTSGPISVFLALEHGPAFAAKATSGSLVATAAQALFGLVYCLNAPRGWLPSLCMACGAFAISAALLQWIDIPVTGLFVIALLAAALMLQFTPKDRSKRATLAAPWWDLPGRVVLITGLVIAVTLVAPFIGPEVSGVIASFPFMAAILAVFAHCMSGHISARQVLRGMVSGLFGFALFFYVLSQTLTRTSLTVAYGAAIFAALAVQGVAFQRMHQTTVSPLGE